MPASKAFALARYTREYDATDVQVDSERGELLKSGLEDGPVGANGVDGHKHDVISAPVVQRKGFDPGGVHNASAWCHECGVPAWPW